MFSPAHYCAMPVLVPYPFLSCLKIRIGIFILDHILTVISPFSVPDPLFMVVTISGCIIVLLVVLLICCGAYVITLRCRRQSDSDGLYLLHSFSFVRQFYK